MFDGDPDGLAISKTYRFGSRALAQERRFNVPEMRWIGVELEETFRDKQLGQATKELTNRDRSRAKSTLMQDADEAETGMRLLDCKGRRALQHMLMLNRKVEIEVLEEVEGGVAQWVHEKLQHSVNAD